MSSNTELLNKFNDLILALNKVIFGADNEDVVLDGVTKPVISKVLKAATDAMRVAGGLVGFATVAELNAYTPAFPKQLAEVYSTGLQYAWNGTAWVSTGSGKVSKAELNLIASVYPQLLADGTDCNNLTTFGWHKIYPNKTADKILNAPSTVVVSGTTYVNSGHILVLPVSANEMSQVYFPYSVGYPIRIRYRNASGWLAWTDFLDQNAILKDKPLTDGTDVLTLPEGNYYISSLTQGATLINMPAGVPYLYGRIESRGPVGGNRRNITFIPYGRDTQYYENKAYESNWSGWQTFLSKTDSDKLYPSKTDLSAATGSVADAVTKLDYFGKQFTAADLTGINVYAAGYYVGYNKNSGSKGTLFNAIKARIYNPSGEPVQYRVYFGAEVAMTTYGGTVSNANINKHKYEGLMTMPTTDTGSAQESKFDKNISIPPNTEFVIVFRTSALKTMRIGFVPTAGGNLENRGFTLHATNNDWAAAVLSVSSPVVNYVQAGLQLYLNIESSGGGGTPTPEYVPTLVVPPTTYAMEGYQSHMYLAHCVPERANQYDWDYTCAKGQQWEFGWEWSPLTPNKDPDGNYSLTLGVFDSKTGLQLTSKGGVKVTKVPVGNKSGTTQKVSVIGDSLVAGTIITQTLLDNASTNVMGVTLIGTKGTGLNKHEGRGGWTANDYVTDTRKDYQFTVSGVTTTPAINSTTYKFGDTIFLVQETYITSGSGTIICSISSGAAPVAGSSGTLTKDNAGVGDATIAFSDVQAVAGNPFWDTDTNAVSYSKYLTRYSLATPDVVLIQLGINDTFGLASDASVNSTSATIISKLDILIASIKEANPSVKIGICTPPSYADQNAFAVNYSSGQTAWRAKRNIILYNAALIAKYGADANNVYLVPTGYNVDTKYGFPTSVRKANSRSTEDITVQSNGVHPSSVGYRQIGDVMFMFIKAV